MSMSARSRAVLVTRTPNRNGNGCAGSIQAAGRVNNAGGTQPDFAKARAAFGIAWRIYSATRTETDYQTWRDQRDWTTRKYAMRDRGEQVPLPP